MSFLANRSRTAYVAAGSIQGTSLNLTVMVWFECCCLASIWPMCTTNTAVAFFGCGLAHLEHPSAAGRQHSPDARQGMVLATHIWIGPARSGGISGAATRQGWRRAGMPETPSWFAGASSMKTPKLAPTKVPLAVRLNRRHLLRRSSSVTIGTRERWWLTVPKKSCWTTQLDPANGFGGGGGSAPLEPKVLEEPDLRMAEWEWTKGGADG